MGEMSRVAWRGLSRGIAASLCVVVWTLASPALAEGGSEEATSAPVSEAEETLFGSPVTRGGFHFQVAFGWGGGADVDGLFHAMELGYTFSNGWTAAYLHTFIQSDGFGQARGGPDLIGGHLLALKVPLWVPEVVVKLAVGVGGTHDQSDGIEAHLGMGWAWGVDLHLPVTERSGFTLGLTSLHTALKGHQHWGVALGGGYTFF